MRAKCKLKLPILPAACSGVLGDTLTSHMLLHSKLVEPLVEELMLLLQVQDSLVPASQGWNRFMLINCMLIKPILMRLHCTGQGQPGILYPQPEAGQVPARGAGAAGEGPG